MPRFKNKQLQLTYETCRRIARDNWSEFYRAKTTAGFNAMGPNAPRTGAGHRCAYWAGRFGEPTLYSGFRGSLGYACWAAGQDDRKEDFRNKKRK